MKNNSGSHNANDMNAMMREQLNSIKTYEGSGSARMSKKISLNNLDQFGKSKSPTEGFKSPLAARAS